MTVNEWSIKPSCYVCKKSNKLLVSVKAPGQWFICDDCIRESEQNENKVAILSYAQGLFFVDPDEVSNYVEDNTDAK